MKKFITLMGIVIIALWGWKALDQSGLELSAPFSGRAAVQVEPSATVPDRAVQVNQPANQSANQSVNQSVNQQVAQAISGTKQRGVSWVAGTQVVTADDFDTLVENHVNWIVQTPFGWQDDYNSPQVSLTTTGTYWGETDEGLNVTTQLAQSFGIKTLLKPHIWLTRPSEGKWRTEIDMRSEQDWQRWFSDYRRFILHYATFAESHDIPILCVGTELQTTAVKREQDWRSLIAEIRQVYHGQLTYAANWNQAFEAIQFWDALDFIGIQAYFPLSNQETPSVEALQAGWRQHLPSIEAVQSRYQKPVIFTELGYRSTDDAAIDPWTWPGGSETRPTEFATPSGLTTQANCYEAFFQTVWPQDWLVGVYIWKWFPKLNRSSDAVGQGFTPQNKPAEAVLNKWYSHTLTLDG